MMYPYMTLADDTEIVHSHVFDEDGVKKVLVHFERPTEEGFEESSPSIARMALTAVNIA